MGHALTSISFGMALVCQQVLLEISRILMSSIFDGLVSIWWVVRARDSIKYLRRMPRHLVGKILSAACIYGLRVSNWELFDVRWRWIQKKGTFWPFGSILEHLNFPQHLWNIGIPSIFDRQTQVFIRMIPLSAINYWAEWVEVVIWPLVLALAFEVARGSWSVPDVLPGAVNAGRSRVQRKMW